MATQPIWRSRELGGHRSSAAAQSGAIRRIPRYPDLRGRVDFLADGFATALRGRIGLRFEVGYGVDARYAELLSTRSDPSQIPPQPADLSDGLRVHREFRAAALARRSRVRKGIADRKDARR